MNTTLAEQYNTTTEEQEQEQYNSSLVISKGQVHMVSLPDQFDPNSKMNFMFEDGSTFDFQDNKQYELVDLTCSITSQLQFLYSRLCFQFQISISKDNKHIDFDETIHVGIHVTHGFLPLVDPIFKIPENTKWFDFKKEKRAVELLKKVAYNDPQRNAIYFGVQTHYLPMAFGMYHILFTESNLINVPFLDDSKVLAENTVITLTNATVLPSEPTKKRNLENKENISPVVVKKLKRQ